MGAGSKLAEELLSVASKAPEGTKTASKVLQQLQKGEGVIFTTSNGKFGGTPQSVTKTFKELKAAGMEPQAVEGIYGGTKEPSIFVPTASPEQLKHITDLAARTGQESILLTKPNGAELLSTAGPEAGKVTSLGGMSVSDKPIATDAQSALKLANGKKLYLQYGTGESQGVHYSNKPGLQTLDPNYAGTGADASKFRGDLPETKTVHMYGELGATPEPTVSTNEKYIGNYNPNTAYDFTKDPNGYLTQAQKLLREGGATGNPKDKVDLAKRLAKEAGYKSIIWDMGGEQGKIVENFEPTPVIQGFNEQPKSTTGKVLDALATPQRILMNKLAQASGVQGDPKDASKSIENIVENAAKELGVPETSQAGAAIKSAVASLAEVFVDPVGFIPLGKISKGIKAAQKSAIAIKALEKMAPALEKAAPIIERAKPGIDFIKKLADKTNKIANADILAPLKSKPTAEGAYNLTAETAKTNLGE